MAVVGLEVVEAKVEVVEMAAVDWEVEGAMAAAGLVAVAEKVEVVEMAAVD